MELSEIYFIIFWHYYKLLILHYSAESKTSLVNILKKLLEIEYTKKLTKIWKSSWNLN